MMKNESDLLKVVLPIWINYPIDHFVFYDDNSSDDSLEVIGKYLEKSRYTIINDRLDEFNESHNRSRMYEFSKGKCDYIFCIDCDELLSYSILNNFNNFLKLYDSYNLSLYWYNIIGSIDEFRYDPQYRHAFGGFVTNTKNPNKMNLSLKKYHTTGRFPTSNLPNKNTHEFGIIHLQSLNLKYYVTKQMWYKHFEYKNWSHSINEINSKYDPVVNNLEFNPQKTPDFIKKDINIDYTIFEGLEERKGYSKYIRENYTEELVTFGKNYFTYEKN
jgi:hypothetical protein